MAIFDNQSPRKKVRGLDMAWLAQDIYLNIVKICDLNYTVLLFDLILDMNIFLENMTSQLLPLISFFYLILQVWSTYWFPTPSLPSSIWFFNQRNFVWNNTKQIMLGIPNSHKSSSERSSKSGHKVMLYNRSQFDGNHALSYTITNLTLVAIRSPKGFRIRQHIAEKRGTLLF